MKCECIMNEFHNFFLLLYDFSVKMTPYKSKIILLQLIKLKSPTKNKAGVTLRLSANITGNTNDKTDLPHKLWLTAL